MPTEVIPIGFPVTMVTNQVYALPLARVSMFSDAAVTMEQSNVIGFGTKQAITLTAGVSPLDGAFVRATAGTPTVILKKV